MNDKQLHKLLQQDHVGNPDPQVHDRLNYAFLLKSARQEARQNSFAGFAGWLFSAKAVGIKTLAASLLVALFLAHPALQGPSGSQPLADSTYIQQTQAPDTTLFQLNFSTTDSVRNINQ